MDTATRYRRWAAVEAHESSKMYERLALAVAEDAFTLALLGTVPPEKQQPNLLFAAIRWHNGPVGEPDECLRWLRDHADDVRTTVLARRTQTNEVARCAVLLPALAQLPAPLAVIEVGASAGLCLLYERWGYRYLTGAAEHTIPAPPASPTLTCHARGDPPLPTAVPDIEWRCGLDLNPLDPADEADARWLECCVWPEHADRAATLRSALAVAAGDPAPVRVGDLAHDLDAILALAPAAATTVVTHSATLAYADLPTRERFLDVVERRHAHRVGLEGIGVLPRVDAQLPSSVDGAMVVSIDDRAVATAHPHGRWLRWLDD